MDRTDEMKILIFRIGAIGDVIMTTALVRAVRKRYPDAKISYLVGKTSAQVLEGNKNVDEIITFDDEIMFKKQIFKVLGLIRQIRKKKFDTALTLDKSRFAGLFIRLCKIQKRIGFDRKGEGKNHTIKVPYDGTKNEADYYAELGKKMDAFDGYELELPIRTEDMDWAKKEIGKLKKPVCISPGGAKNIGQEATIKRYTRYDELADLLIERYGSDIVLVGSKGDKEVTEKIKKNSKYPEKIHDYAGKTTIKQAGALIKNCKLMITHDSGPAHITAAVKTPLIVMFGPTPSKRFAPKNSVVVERKECICYDIYGKFSPKIKDCLSRINPQEIIQAIEHNKLLK